MLQSAKSTELGNRSDNNTVNYELWITLILTEQINM